MKPDTADAASDLSQRAAAWREAFDRAFAEPPPEVGARPLDFLGITLAGRPHGLRLSELAALQAVGEITPYPAGPGAPPELLGLVAHRGTVLPLYELQSLLGLGQANGAPAWMVVLRGTPLALAFERFDGHWRVPPSACVTAEGGAGQDLVLNWEGQVRPVIDLATIAASLRRQQ